LFDFGLWLAAFCGPPKTRKDGDADGSTTQQVIMARDLDQVTGVSCGCACEHRNQNSQNVTHYVVSFFKSQPEACADAQGEVNDKARLVPDQGQPGAFNLSGQMASLNGLYEGAIPPANG